MAARKAAAYVTVGGITYAPGDEVPADLVDLVDNPAAWEGDSESEKKPARKAASRSDRD